MDGADWRQLTTLQRIDAVSGFLNAGNSREGLIK